MRYYKIYRNCCRVKADEEMPWEEFDQAVWDEAWNRACEQNEQDDDEDEDKYLDRIEVIAGDILDALFREAESEDGCNVGDYYFFIRPEDVSFDDMKGRRPN